MPEFKVRQAKESDLPLLALWNKQLIDDEAHKNPMSKDELYQRMKGWLEKDYKAAIFEMDGVPLAYALWREDPEGVYLRQFFMERSQRRKGLGREAVQLWLKEMRPRNKRVWLEALVNNEAGRKFWAACGFGEYAVTMELRDGD
jgi:GNAT superfamily N-acetyltransferase